ncbi:hypothetical protein WISP_86293 [Willisornis vidua]|uniref:Uncharacterized protein n=1 Tax=Willisornis vidua TaxID=1566151 RepID=A0ABQ9D381_9PASS|nr:hypothetical protein WISP_86293 [Willisornis vidua]
MLPGSKCKNWQSSNSVTGPSPDPAQPILHLGFHTEKPKPGVGNVLGSAQQAPEEDKKCSLLQPTSDRIKGKSDINTISSCLHSNTSSSIWNHKGSGTAAGKPRAEGRAGCLDTAAHAHGSALMAWTFMSFPIVQKIGKDKEDHLSQLLISLIAFLTQMTRDVCAGPGLVNNRNLSSGVTSDFPKATKERSFDKVFTIILPYIILMEDNFGWKDGDETS